MRQQVRPKTPCIDISMAIRFAIRYLGFFLFLFSFSLPAIFRQDGLFNPIINMSNKMISVSREVMPTSKHAFNETVAVRDKFILCSSVWWKMRLISCDKSLDFPKTHASTRVNHFFWCTLVVFCFWIGFNV